MTEAPYLIPIWDTVSKAWEKVKGSKGPIWGVIGIIILVAIVFGILGMIAKSIHPFLYEVVKAIGHFIIFLIELGLIYISIKRAYDLPIFFRQAFRPFEGPIFFRIIGVYILKFLIYLPFGFLITLGVFFSPLGLLLTIAASLGLCYLAVRLIFAVYYVLDKGTSPWLAIKLSYLATRGNFWRLIALFFIQLGFSVLALIPLCIGLIWVIPLGLILFGLVYRHLLINISDNL